MGGNIGNSPLDWLVQEGVPQDATIVLELSSYALEYFNDDHVLDVSIIISFSQNHLSRHRTLEEYARVKTAGILPEKTKVYLGDTEEVRHYIIPALNHRGNQEVTFVDLEKAQELIGDFHEVKMLGEHNLINIGLVTQVLQDLNLFDPKAGEGLKNYSGLAHRIEFVAEKEGIRWINDSKSTSPDATVKALEAVATPQGKILLVAGGVDKGVTYEPWGAYFDPEKVRSLIILPGPADQELIQIAQDHGIEVKLFEEKEDTLSLMKSVVTYAQKEAHSGDVVLLSPGAASLNLWKGFEARGDDFMQAVRES
jgi:UDP-N-acetylmuramoylalanine--D-glutamate ligase